jgi:hypothetical protein
MVDCYAAAAANAKEAGARSGLCGQVVFSCCTDRGQVSRQQLVMSVGCRGSAIFCMCVGAWARRATS